MPTLSHAFVLVNLQPHLGGYKKTQYIPRFWCVLQESEILLEQSSVTATSAFLGVSDNSALELARNINI